MASLAKQRIDKAVHQARFLSAYESCADICLAARWAKVSRTAHYQWLNTDPTYADRFAAAGRRCVDVFISEGVRRAVRGVDKPVFYKGKIVGKINERSDALLLAFLKAKVPEFKEKEKESSVPNSSNSITFILQMIMQELADAPIEIRNRLGQRLMALSAPASSD